VVSIIHTHAHLDHFLASGQLKEKTGATLHLHKEDQFLWDNLEMQCQMFGVPTPCRRRTVGLPMMRRWPVAAAWLCIRQGIHRAR
jgi:glyoxylase-like metal-dependent hydrolase (beta-lactamase superfamily II)